MQDQVKVVEGGACKYLELFQITHVHYREISKSNQRQHPLTLVKLAKSNRLQDGHAIKFKNQELVEVVGSGGPSGSLVGGLVSADIVGEVSG